MSASGRDIKEEVNKNQTLAQSLLQICVRINMDLEIVQILNMFFVQNFKKNCNTVYFFTLNKKQLTDSQMASHFGPDFTLTFVFNQKG